MDRMKYVQLFALLHVIALLASCNVARKSHTEETFNTSAETVITVSIEGSTEEKHGSQTPTYELFADLDGEGAWECITVSPAVYGASIEVRRGETTVYREAMKETSHEWGGYYLRQGSNSEELVFWSVIRTDTRMIVRYEAFCFDASGTKNVLKSGSKMLNIDPNIPVTSQDVVLSTLLNEINEQLENCSRILLEYQGGETLIGNEIKRSDPKVIRFTVDDYLSATT